MKSNIGTGDWRPLLLGTGEEGDDDNEEERVVPCESVSVVVTWVGAKSREEAVVTAVALERQESDRLNAVRHV